VGWTTPPPRARRLQRGYLPGRRLGSSPTRGTLLDMRRAALLAAALLFPTGPAASIDFGPVELGRAASHVLRVSALDATASGAGFSATRTRGGVLIVFEPYELDEQATGTLTLKTGSGLVRIRLLGHGVDRIPPRVAVETPRGATAGHALQIRFNATDNDLVDTCTLMVGGNVIGRLSWPSSTFRWLVPTGLRRPVRITVVAVDRAGNHASATTRPVPLRP
jgi:hypothetical protein